MEQVANLEQVEIDNDDLRKKNEKKYMHLITIFVKIIFVFFTVFFNVYVYEISNDLNFTLLYMLFYLVVNFLCEVIIFKFANDKVLKVLYKLSFLMCLVSILLTFTITPNTLYMVFVAQTSYAVASVFYYIPSEVMTMEKNSKSQMGKFIGINAVMSLFSQALSPFLSGVIISYVSYYILFAIISLIALICIILSFKIKKVCEVNKRISIKTFVKTVHSYKGIRYGYFGYGLFKFSQDGVIDTIIPVLIFIRTGGNFSVGLYAAFATLISGIALMLYVYLAKDKKLAMYLSTIALIIASIFIIFFNSLTMFFIYYFIKKSVYEILRATSFESLFTLPKGTSMEDYKIEQHLVFSFYNKVFLFAAYLFALLIYNFIKSEIAISIILLFLSLSQIASTILILKSDQLRAQNL